MHNMCYFKNQKYAGNDKCLRKKVQSQEQVEGERDRSRIL